MFEDPSEYYYFYGILLEIALISLFYRPTSVARSQMIAALRNGPDEVRTQNQRDDAADFVILGRSSGILAGGFVVFVGYIVTWVIPFVLFPNDIIGGKAWTSFVTAQRFAFMISLAFLSEIVSWVPLIVALTTFTAATEEGMWMSRMTSKKVFVGWNQVSRVRFNSTLSLSNYTILTEKGDFGVSMNASGFSDFAKLAVEKLPASSRPRGVFALEQMIEPPEKHEADDRPPSTTQSSKSIETTPPHESSMAMIGGVLILVSGVLGVLNGIYFADPSVLGVSPSGVSYLGNLETTGYLMLAGGTCAIAGGLLAIKRRYYWSCVVGGFLGAICGGFTFGYLFGMVGMAVAALAYKQFTKTDILL